MNVWVNIWLCICLLLIGLYQIILLKSNRQESQLFDSQWPVPCKNTAVCFQCGKFFILTIVKNHNDMIHNEDLCLCESTCGCSNQYLNLWQFAWITIQLTIVNKIIVILDNCQNEKLATLKTHNGLSLVRILPCVFSVANFSF